MIAMPPEQWQEFLENTKDMRLNLQGKRALIAPVDDIGPIAIEIGAKTATECKIDMKDFLEVLRRTKEEINYPPKLFLTREEIEYFVKAGYPANMFVPLPKQAGTKEEEDVNKESN